jgi:hypothetical protein
MYRIASMENQNDRKRCAEKYLDEILTKYTFKRIGEDNPDLGRKITDLQNEKNPKYKANRNYDIKNDNDNIIDSINYVLNQKQQGKRHMELVAILDEILEFIKDKYLV